MSHKFTRLELYRLVWSEPLRKLAQRFGISGVAIAKRCRRSNIPLPGLGYCFDAHRADRADGEFGLRHELISRKSKAITAEGAEENEETQIEPPRRQEKIRARI